MSLFGERSAPLDGADAVDALEPEANTHHQSSRELRRRVVGHLQRWDNKTMTRMCSDLGCRHGHYDDGWKRTRRKGANRKMLAMWSFPFCERSAIVFARQASGFPRVCCNPSSTNLNNMACRVILACICVKLLVRLCVCHRVGPFLGPFLGSIFGGVHFGGSMFGGSMFWGVHVWGVHVLGGPCLGGSMFQTICVQLLLACPESITCATFVVVFCILCKPNHDGSQGMDGVGCSFGWIQVLRGPRPPSQQWPSSKRRATSIVESPAQRQQRTHHQFLQITPRTVKLRELQRSVCIDRQTRSEGSEIGNSSSHSRSEIPLRCSEEGQSGSTRHPSCGAVRRVPEVCCKMREVYCCIGCRTVQGIGTFGRRKIKSGASPTDDDQPASRAPSRFIIRGGAIAKTSGPFATAIGARCGCTTCAKRQAVVPKEQTVRLREDRQADLQDATRMGNASEVTRLCHKIAETASGMAQSSELRPW